jgi:hypothetical protein
MFSSAARQVRQRYQRQAPRAGDRPTGKFTVTCASFHPLVRNTLRGFAEITIAELRLTVRDLAIHQKGDARWAQLPAKAQIKDGALVKDATGKVQYVHIMHFDSRAVRDAFSRVVIGAVLEFAPAAFEDDEGA